MATSFEELQAIAESLRSVTSSEVEQARASPSAIEYATDIAKAPFKGLSRAVQGLLELGALPIDYVGNTNLIKHIDDVFEKITPETHTGVGELVSTFTQFGLPLGVVTKLAGGIKVLNNATRIRKLSTLESPLDKAGELVRRMGYYGAIGGASDIIASVPERDQTLTETFGLTEKKDVTELSGSERAAETLKSKFKFGAEGTVVGGAIPLLPTAANLGYRYGLVPAAKGVILAGETVLRPLNYTVINPLTQLIAGVESKGIIPKLMTSTSELVEKGYGKVAGKLGIPPVDEWKYATTKGTIGEYVVNRLNYLKEGLSSPGVLGKEIAAEKFKFESTIASKSSRAEKLDLEMQSKLEELITNGETKFLKEEKTLYELQSQNNTIFSYIKTPGEKANTILKTLDKDIQPLAKEMKDILKKSNLEFGEALVKEGGESYIPLAQEFIQRADSATKQRFAAFNNKNYQYPVEANQKAIELMEQRIRSEKDYMNIAAVKARVKKIPIDQAIKEQAIDQLEKLKNQLIDSNKSPEYFFNAISNSFRIKRPTITDLRPGETFPDVIKNLFDAPQTLVKDGKTIPITNYKTAVINTVIQQAKSIYQKRYFDETAKLGLENGYIFRSPEEAMAKLELKGMPLDKRIRFANTLQKIEPRGERKNVDLSTFATDTSILFKEPHYATSEFTNALLDSNKNTNSLFDNPIIKGLMVAKSGAQITKTILSPQGQVRNFTGGGLYVFANGLLGGRVSMKDAAREIMSDLFNYTSKNPEEIKAMIASDIKRGISKDVEGVMNYLNDAKKYGVIDQNVIVNELGQVMTDFSKGKMSFEAMMNNKFMKKLSSIYQGSDNFWKVFSDKFYTAALRPAMNNLDDVADWFQTIAKQKFNPNDLSTGLKKDLEQGLREMSAYLVTNTIPTYSKLPEFIKKSRNIPFGNFVAYPSEILRTQANILTIGARELTSNNPLIRQMGAKRLIGSATTLGGIGTAFVKTSEYITGVTEDKMDAFQRNFAADYERNSVLIPLTSPDSKGNFKYFNFSYTNPYNTIIQPVNAILKAYGDGTLKKDSVSTIVKNSLFGTMERPGAMYELFSPFFTESIGLETLADVVYRDGRTKSGSYIYYPQDDDLTKISKGIGHFFSTLEPGASASVRKIWEGATGKFTQAGTIRDPGTEALALFGGVRIQEAKPLASMPFILTSYSKDRENIGIKFSSIAYSPSATQEQRIKAFRDFFVESYDSQTKMYQTLKDAQKLGIDESTVNDILQKRLKNKTDVSNLINGIFKTPNFSEDRFKALIDRLSLENPVQAAKLESQINNVKDVFQDLKSNFIGSDLGLSKEVFSNKIDRILTPPVRRVRPSGPTPVLDLSSAFTPPGNYLRNTSATTYTNNLAPTVINSTNQNALKTTPEELKSVFGKYKSGGKVTPAFFRR